MKRYLMAMVPAAMALGWSPTGHSGVVITLESKSVHTHQTKQIELYVRQNQIAYRDKDGSGMIFDGDRQVSWNYDTKHGIYLKMDADSARAIRRQARRAAKRREKTFRQEMAELPTERRKLMQKQFQSLKPHKPHYERLGSQKKVGRWRCTPVARVGPTGKQRERMCIASYKELGIPPQDRKVFESMDRFVAMMGPDHHSAHSRFTLQAEDELGLHGIAIRDEYAGIATKVVAVRHEKVSADVFRLPKGLKEISLFRAPLR